MDIHIELKSLPVFLVCHWQSRCIAFVRRAHNFPAICEVFSDGTTVVVDDDSIRFFGEKLARPLDIAYNDIINWRDSEVLTKWLHANELIMPRFKQPDLKEYRV